MVSFELISMGSASVDLCPEEAGVPLTNVDARASTLVRSLGGSAAGVAVAVSRLDHPAAVITRVGGDGCGSYVRSTLEKAGVDTRWVGTDPDLGTPVTLYELSPPDRIPLRFYGEPKAPNTNLTLDDLDVDAITAVRILWTTGAGLAAEPGRGATLAALDARSSVFGGITVHDLDFNPMIWNSKREAGRCAREALRHATVAIGALEEVEMAIGLQDPLEASAGLLDLGLELAIVRTENGVLARTPGKVFDLRLEHSQVVNNRGAKSAFGGALCHALLCNWELERAIRYADAARAAVAARRGGTEGMPTAAEIENLLRG